MTAMIDLSQRAFAYQRAEITGVGTWLKLEDQWRPVLALMRAGEELAGHTTPYIITMDKAWIWDERVGDGAEVARQIVNIANALRLDHDERTIFKIFAFINDHLGDLISMPPLPPNQALGTVIAEATITDRDSGTQYEVELTDV